MTYRVPEHVHAHRLHDEVVLLDARRDAFHGLNSSAAVVWAALAAGQTPRAAAETLAEHFGVKPETARADVAVLIDELVERGLLEREAP